MLYVSNSIGAFFGAISFHYIGTEALGSRGSLLALAVAMCITTLWVARPPAVRSRAITATSIAVAVIASIVPMQTFLFGSKIMGYDRAFIEEGSSGVTAITWNDSGSGMAFVNGQGMGLVPVEPKHTLQFGVALAVVPAPKHVLVMGLGSGSYVRELLAIPEVKSITAVDWSHELPRVLARPGVVARMGVTVDDPRLKIISGDARLAVALLPTASFDLVLDNLVYPTWVGATGVRSKSYFANISKLVSKDGVYGITANYARWRDELLAGLLASFGHVYENGNGHMIIATNKRAAIELDRASLVGLAEKYAPRSSLSSADYAKMLIGLKKVDSSTIVAAPFEESRVFSEYYYTPKEFSRFLFR